jgi:hypothetical protein
MYISLADSRAKGFKKRNYALAKADVAAQERAHGHTPSEPQVFVGQHMTGFYAEPVF